MKIPKINQKHIKVAKHSSHVISIMTNAFVLVHETSHFIQIGGILVIVSFVGGSVIIHLIGIKGE